VCKRLIIILNVMVNTSAGLAMLVAGLVLWQVEGMSALIGLWVCGLLVLIPGVYFTRVAYLAYKGVEGYSWADIPDWPSAS
jgi:hypothetical protein